MCGPWTVGGGSWVQSGPSSYGSPLRAHIQYARPARPATTTNAPSSSGSADELPLLPPLSWIAIGPLKFENGAEVEVVGAADEFGDVVVVVEVDVVVLLEVVVLDFVVVVGAWSRWSSLLRPSP